MSTVQSSAAILISPDLNIGMVILYTHLSGAATFGSFMTADCRPSATSNERAESIVAQLIHRFCADDHNCNQWRRAAYNERL
jgi:hypothetical protein